MPAAFAGITPPLSMQKTCKQLNFQNQTYCDHKRAQSKLRLADFEQITLVIVSFQWRVKFINFFALKEIELSYYTRKIRGKHRSKANIELNFP